MRTAPNTYRLLCGWAARVAALCALAAAAASHAQEPPPASQPAEAGGAYQAPESPAELLKIDESVRGFFAPWVSRSSTEHERVCAIVNAILLPEGLNFSYDAAATFDARETFRRRRGNCTSFSMLVVAVAREFGVDVSFVSTRRPVRWQRLGGIVVSVQHLAVNAVTTSGTYLIDLELIVAPDAELGTMRKIADATAFALFYCNIGFTRLVLGDTEGALRYTTLATEVDPKCASAWANRGTILTRMGDLVSAKDCYQRALRSGSQGETALDSLVAVLRQLGSPEDLREADKLERRASTIRNRNPFYHQELARRALAEGDLVTAEKRLRRAISLQGDERDFYVQWISVLNQLGRTDDAHRAARKLQKLDRKPDPQPVVPRE